MSRVVIKEDLDSEMLEIYVDGKLLNIGNFWDFDTRDTLENVLSVLGVGFDRIYFEYEG